MRERRGERERERSFGTTGLSIGSCLDDAEGKERRLVSSVEAQRQKGPARPRRFQTKRTKAQIWPRLAAVAVVSKEFHHRGENEGVEREEREKENT